MKKYTQDTLCVTGTISKETGALVTPIYQSSTFVFDSVEQGAARFAGQEPGYIYTRLGNPTISEFEQKMARLEGAEDGVAFASGMAAVSAVLMYALKAGDHMIAHNSLYGCTYDFMENLLKRYGVNVTFVDATNLDNVKEAMRPNTRIIYIETPSNPRLTVVDIKGIAEIAHGQEAEVIVDNTFLSPYFQKPLSLGADYVLHSATKYIGGHGDVVAGILLGKEAALTEIRWTTQKNIGGVTNPFDAWLLIRGLKTLGIRMKAHETNAMKVAQFLENHEKVEAVYYPGLPSHPQHELAATQASGFGGVIAFELKGGLEAGKTLMHGVELIKLAVSLGAVDSLIEHPASMTHSAVPPEERIKSGITDGLVRLSVGIEDAEDLIEDLRAALAQI